MNINRNRYSHNIKSTISIDFQYQSINCYWLLLIIIDFIDYRKPLIDNAGKHVPSWDDYEFVVVSRLFMLYWTWYHTDLEQMLKKKNAKIFVKMDTECWILLVK